VLVKQIATAVQHAKGHANTFIATLQHAAALLISKMARCNMVFGQLMVATSACAATHPCFVDTVSDTPGDSRESEHGGPTMQWCMRR
jgi:hypothetical protein